jgi:hypothetical protein
VLNNNYAAFLALFLLNIQAFIRCETLVIYRPTPDMKIKMKTATYVKWNGSETVV